MELFLNEKQVTELAERYPGMSTEAALNAALENALRDKSIVDSCDYERARRIELYNTVIIVLLMIIFVLWLT
jgi:hypothetical protein